MILPINHIVDWSCISQHKQMHINKDSSRKNTTRIDHNYIVGYKAMTNMSSAYKYETPVQRPVLNFPDMDKWDSHLTDRRGYTHNTHP